MRLSLTPMLEEALLQCSVPDTGDTGSGSGRVTGVRKIKGDIWAPGEEVKEFCTMLRGMHRPHQSSWSEKQQAQGRGEGKGSPLCPRKHPEKMQGDPGLHFYTVQLA